MKLGCIIQKLEIKMILSKILTKLTLLFFLVLNISAAERTEMLISLEKIAEINRQLNRELTAWNSERETLKLQLSLLKSSMEDSSNDQKKLFKTLEELKEKKKKLEEILVNQVNFQKSVNSFLDKNFEFLSSSIKKIPGSLQFLLKDEASNLDRIMKSTASLPEEKLNALNAVTVSLMKAQKEVHLTKEVLTLNGEKMEARALYLGTFTGYFYNPGKNTAGRMILVKDQWQAIEDKDLLNTVKTLFGQFDKKGAPELIELPVGSSQ